MSWIICIITPNKIKRNTIKNDSSKQKKEDYEDTEDDEDDEDPKDSVFRDVGE